MAHQLYIEAHTPVGVFEGVAHEGTTSDIAGLEELSTKMQSRGVTSLVLYQKSASNGKREITLSEGVLSRSVLIYEIQKVA